MLDTPELIRNRRDFDIFLEKIKVNDPPAFVETFHKNLADTKTKVLGVFQMIVKLYNMKDPIGANIILPDIILNSKFLYNAVYPIAGKDDDKLCFWRCLAKYFNPSTPHRKLIRISKKLFREYYNVSPKEYAGVNVTEFDDIERKFDIEIRYYEIYINPNSKGSDTLEAIKKRSCKNESKALTLGLYESHFVFIHNVQKLCKSYKCEHCDAIFTEHDNMVRHQRNTCGKLFKEKFTEKIERFQHKENIMKIILKACNSKKVLCILISLSMTLSRALLMLTNGKVRTQF